jgi:hypothetical protein
VDATGPDRYALLVARRELRQAASGVRCGAEAAAAEEAHELTQLEARFRLELAVDPQLARDYRALVAHARRKLQGVPPRDPAQALCPAAPVDAANRRVPLRPVATGEPGVAVAGGTGRRTAGLASNEVGLLVEALALATICSHQVLVVERSHENRDVTSQIFGVASDGGVFVGSGFTRIESPGIGTTLGFGAE